MDSYAATHICNIKILCEKVLTEVATHIFWRIFVFKVYNRAVMSGNLYDEKKY